MNLTAIILTHNEEMHILRCLESVSQLTSQIVVVDCYSSDQTVQIAQAFGAVVIQRAWDGSHATQVNWAIHQLADLDYETQWVIRIDADEILTPELIIEIHAALKNPPKDLNGISCIRKITFQGQLIRFGGVGRNRVMRLFRYGFGVSESRWMDEHIKVQGATMALSGAIIDDNLRPLAWWIEKHNGYSSREAIDLLNLEYHFALQNSVASLTRDRNTISTKRWIKEKIYAKLPGGFRSLLYFLWRYFVLLGFLDGSKGTQFHFFQAFWYRYLVDCKVVEVKKYMSKHQVNVQIAIKHILGISIAPRE